MPSPNEEKENYIILNGKIFNHSGDESVFCSGQIPCN